MFQQPSQGDKFDVSEHVGSLCLFFVKDILQGINTPFGEKEAVSCDVHVLDGTDADEIFHDCLIFQGGLIGSLRRAVSADPVLARIGTGVSKPGQKPPYLLAEFTDADAAKAEAYLTERAKKFQNTNSNGSGQGPTSGQNAGSSTPAKTPAASSAVPNGLSKEAFEALPDEVKALLAQR